MSIGVASFLNEMTARVPRPTVGGVKRVSGACSVLSTSCLYSPTFIHMPGQMTEYIEGSL